MDHADLDAGTAVALLDAQRAEEPAYRMLGGDVARRRHRGRRRLEAVAAAGDQRQTRAVLCEEPGGGESDAAAGTRQHDAPAVQRGGHRRELPRQPAAKWIRCKLPRRRGECRASGQRRQQERRRHAAAASGAATTPPRRTWIAAVGCSAPNRLAPCSLGPPASASGGRRRRPPRPGSPASRGRRRARAAAVPVSALRNRFPLGARAGSIRPPAAVEWHPDAVDGSSPLTLSGGGLPRGWP